MSSRGDINRRAADIVAAKTATSPAEVERIIKEYRRASDGMHAEPDWQLLMSISGATLRMLQYSAPETEITLQVESHKTRDAWEQHRYYVFKGKIYEEFAEAKEAELLRRDIGDPDLTNVVPLGDATIPE